jgi:Zn-dependent alcohol dehydrogenase
MPSGTSPVIDKDMPLAQAALIGCGVVIGYGAAVNVDAFRALERGEVAHTVIDIGSTSRVTGAPPGAGTAESDRGAGTHVCSDRRAP